MKYMKPHYKDLGEKIWPSEIADNMSITAKDRLLSLVQQELQGCEAAVTEWLNEDENVEKEMDDDEIIVTVINIEEQNESDSDESDDDKEKKDFSF